MIGSPKEWASLLGFDRDSDEKTMAARARVLARTIGYLQDHFADPDGARPSEELVMELGQFLVLAEATEAKGRAGKFKELYDTIVQLHLGWDEMDRDEAFGHVARKIAMFRGILAFSDAWLGTETPIPTLRPEPEPELMFDEADVKTRIVRPAHLRP